MVSLRKDAEPAYRTEWSSLAYSVPNQYDAWQDTLNRTYCDFDVSLSKAMLQ